MGLKQIVGGGFFSSYMQSFQYKTIKILYGKYIFQNFFAIKAVYGFNME